MEEKRMRAVLLAADIGLWDAERSIEELRALCDTAELDVVAEVVQHIDSLNSATYVGSGKAAETAELAKRLEADIIVVDDSLSGAQTRNLEDLFELPVIDRTVLILDIFAQSAKTAEGKVQVELAQLQYRLPRLMGIGGALSQQGAGIGTRGPGETKLETDRRHIRNRIRMLKQRLLEMEQRREVTRGKRQKSGVPTVALVGYTNVGKSSLLNALTGSDVLAQDKLFATLDPTARKLSVGNLQQVVLVDTVGFVSRLPHDLVEAFKSTLAEAKYADLILQVTDASDGSWPQQLEVTKQVLEQIGCTDTPIITVFNKCDRIDTAAALPGLHVSAKTGDGLDELLGAISEALSERVVKSFLLFPYSEIGRSSLLRARGNIISERYTEDGLLVEATVEKALWPSFAQFEYKE